MYKIVECECPKCNHEFETETEVDIEPSYNEGYL